MLLAAMLMLAAAQDAPRELPTWTLTEADGTRVSMIGFAAFGADAALAQLDVAAKALNLRTARISNGSLPELMVVFDSQIAKDQALALYARAEVGDFGALKIGRMVMPANKAK